VNRTHLTLFLAGLALAAAGCSSGSPSSPAPLQFTTAMLAGHDATIACQYDALHWRFAATGATVTSGTSVTTSGTWRLTAKGKLIATFPSVEEVVTLQADLGPSLEVTRFQAELAEPIQTCIMTLD